METVNISVPKPLYNQIDRTVQKEGYASRSEFFRTLLRFYFYSVQKARTTGGIDEKTQFEPFVKRPLDEIEEEMTATGEYSAEFVKSVTEGLAKSSYYQDENTTAA